MSKNQEHTLMYGAVVDHQTYSVYIHRGVLGGWTGTFYPHKTGTCELDQKKALKATPEQVELAIMSLRQQGVKRSEIE